MALSSEKADRLDSRPSNVYNKTYQMMHSCNISQIGVVMGDLRLLEYSEVCNDLSRQNCPKRKLDICLKCVLSPKKP